MSWHYLQGQEAASWEGSSLAGAPSALSRLIPSAAASCSPANGTACLTASRSGTTSARSTGVPGREARSTSSAAASPARTSAPREEAPVSTERSQGSGAKWPGSSVRFDHATRSWRTAQSSLLADLDVFSGTWPRWGSMRAGVCSELLRSARLIGATESGSFLPTPPESRYGSNRGGSSGRVGPVRLSLQAMAARAIWPTPTVDGNYNRKGASAKSGDGLATAVGGPLNPTWVEWLMGWPMGWTDCTPLATDRFRQWRDSHGRC